MTNEMVKKLAGIAQQLLNDKCLEPYGDGDFDFFQQKMANNQPPTMEQRRAIDFVDIILMWIANNGNKQGYPTDDRIKEFLAKYGLTLD